MAKNVKADAADVNGNPDEQIEAEIYVAGAVYDAAMARARSFGQPLTVIAREIIRQAAVSATEIEHKSVAHVAQRPAGTALKRVRFAIPRGVHETHRDLIRNAGTSMSRVLELGLRHYARTGVIAGTITGRN